MAGTDTTRATFRALLVRTLVLPLALLAVLSAILVAEVLHLASLHRWVDHTDQVIGELHRLQKLFVDSETGLRGFLLTSHADFLEPFEASQGAAPAALAGLRRLTADNPVQRGRLDELAQRWDRWTTLAQRRIADARRGAEPALDDSVRGKAAMDGIRAVVDRLVAEEEALRAARSADVDTTTRRSLWTTAFLSLALGAFMAVAGRRQLVALRERYEDVLAEQRRHTEALKTQEWVSEGRAQLVDALRGDLPERDVAARLLANVARHAGAEVGALYTVADDEARLDLGATFACLEGADGPPPTIAGGRSWIGQVARDGRAQRLADLPEGHVRVASATGSSSPRELVVAPLTAAGRVVGVVELGFLRPCGERELTYLGASAEAGGHALRSARYRAHLEELLAATRRQAQDLQAQQEELRVANEELQQQRDVLERSQARLEEQQEELRATNAQLGDQAARLEQQRDDLERAQTGLVEKADELARANQYKSEFLANMSHELRTPLNSSLILAKLLADNRDGNLSAEQVRFAETIHAAGNDLLALINDILDLSRIEAGKMDLRPERVSIADVVATLERTFHPMAAQKGLAFAAALDAAAPEAIVTDPQRLQQILKNLLSNAVKFTDRGEVSLRVTTSGPDRVAFVVRDTGIGIAREDLDVIFEAFRQVDGSVHRQYGGTGLGLTISRDLARRLGGDVFVESARGGGSTFSVVLPLQLPAQAQVAPRPRTAPPAAAAPPRAPRPPPPPVEGDAALPAAVPRPPSAFPDDRADLPPGARVLLVVEDDPRFGRILYDLAREQQFRCIVAMTAAEALALARAHRPAAIVLDVNLPDGSGLSVLERLKRSPDTRHIPVHVVSVADYTQRALEMGAVGYALKPVSRDDLVEAIRTLEAKSAQRTRRVLVVEDAEIQRDSLRLLLASERVDIAAVGTAREALDALRAGTFDCMVLDLGLPDMSGHELLERMASDADSSFPPVIVYTGRALAADEEAQLRRWSKSVVIKGARSPERLLDEVTLFIHQVESSLPREQQRLLREARSRDAVLEGRRLLLAEDDVRNVFALASVLEPKGAQVEIARNGREALDALARARDGGAPVDLVLMDVMMPVMDGLAAIREIRSDDAWKKLPIIALTAKAMPEDRERCLAAGANDYIAKPLDVEKLLSLVRVWMPR